MKFVAKPLFIALLCAIGSAIGIAVMNPAVAEDGVTESSLVQSINGLVTQLNVLATQGSNQTGGQTGGSGNVNPQKSIQGNSPDPDCLDNYTTWNSSNTFNPNSEWSTHNIPKGSSSSHSDPFTHKSLFIDVNGDGLLDHYASSMYYTYSASNYFTDPSKLGGECLLLNNGKGWDVVYKCYRHREPDPNAPTGSNQTRPIYYGDCAL